MKAQLIMESKGVNFKVIDICDPNNEDERTFMRKNAIGKNNARNAVPPQFFNDDHEDSYCGVRTVVNGPHLMIYLIHGCCFAGLRGF
jgi:hypothetical protein